jgi:nitrogen-specific signal transduction histidine kinase
MPDIGKKARNPRREKRQAPRNKALPVHEELRMLKSALKERIRQLTVLYQMGRDISENENWSDALDRFLMALVRYLHADGSALLLFSVQETRLATRTSFQMDESVLSECRDVLLAEWKKHPRAFEIHSLEGYSEKTRTTCLERTIPWRVSIVPLKHRSRVLGFLAIEKEYKSGAEFGIDYQFLNTIQTIFTEQVANASYISQLRSLSRFNQQVLENINSGVLTTDLEGYVKFFNRRASLLCPQLGKRTDIHFDELFRSGSSERTLHGKVLRSAKDHHVLEVDGADGTGGWFPAKLMTSKMHDENLNGDVLIAIFEDLSDQKQLEGELRRNDRLRTLGHLSASVAHEIRNPLTGIATSVEVLEAKLRGHADSAKYFRAILDEINRLDGIVKNLLDFARPSKPSLRDCFLSDVITRVVTLLSDHAQKRGIRLEVVNALPDDRCRADADQLTQVLLNVVLNALQACRERDEVKILLGNASAGRNRSFLKIDIIDSGPGIPAEIRSSLFEPFVTTKARGTGMGLAISQQIIEEHGGKISCEFLNAGTKFTILIPGDSRKRAAHAAKRSEDHVQDDTHYR